jgi:hypothetical protein
MEDYSPVQICSRLYCISAFIALSMHVPIGIPLCLYMCAQCRNGEGILANKLDQMSCMDYYCKNKIITYYPRDVMYI